MEVAMQYRWRCNGGGDAMEVAMQWRWRFNGGGDAMEVEGYNVLLGVRAIQ